jgi:hypothetical protein
MEFHVGDPNVAEQIYREISADSEAGLSAYLGVRALSALGCLALERGESDGIATIQKALALDDARLSKGFREPTFILERAANLALLGENREALTGLREVAGRAGWTRYQLMIDRRFKKVRDAPEFSELMQTFHPIAGNEEQDISRGNHR